MIFWNNIAMNIALFNPTPEYLAHNLVFLFARSDLLSFCVYLYHIPSLIHGN
jgi:hypothetical protein